MDVGKAPSSGLPRTTCACAEYVNLPGDRTSFSTHSFLASLIRHGGWFCFLTGDAFSSILETGTEVKISDVVSTIADRRRANPRRVWHEALLKSHNMKTLRRIAP